MQDAQTKRQEVKKKTSLVDNKALDVIREEENQGYGFDATRMDINYEEMTGSAIPAATAVEQHVRKSIAQTSSVTP